MSAINKIDYPAYRKSTNGECFVKIRSEQEYAWVQVAQRETKEVVFRYEKMVTPRGIPAIFFDTYIESNEKEFLGAVQKYLDYSETLKSHLNSKK